MAVNGGLPLGIIAAATYEEAASHGARLTMVSDGVGEAENPRRELFGFERTRWAKPPGRGAKPMT